MDVAPKRPGCKEHAGRPGPCPVCGRPTWWNGTRVVKRVVFIVNAAVHCLENFVRCRVRCSDRSCPAGSWTIYEPSGYPHRVFLLSLIAFAVAGLSADVATKIRVARKFGCDRRSVGRWVRWVAGLGDAKEMAQVCLRVDPDGLPPPAAAPATADPVGKAVSMIALLDRLADLLRGHGVRLEPGPGLAAILRHQWDRFRTIFLLTRASPPLRIDPEAVGT